MFLLVFLEQHRAERKEKIRAKRRKRETRTMNQKLLAQHICSIHSIKLTEVRFQLFLPPRTKSTVTLLRLPFLYLIRIHNLMIFLLPFSLRLSRFHRLPASNTTECSTQVYRIIKISNNTSSAISLFSR